MSTRILATAIALSESDGVERSAPGAAPSAFRIWRAGVNVTDYGPHLFTARSAVSLMAAQEARGNLVSIDVDHLSLSQGKDAAPPESRKAVGFHRLGVRPSPDGPEMWAEDVEWTDAVRSGLEKDPPEWRYFSPAYDVNNSGEIVRYLNTALTNNPATWQVNALASLQRTPMPTQDEILRKATEMYRRDQARANRQVPRLDASERRMFANLHRRDPLPDRSTTIKATRRGSSLMMPAVNPTQAQARARVAELDTELAAIRAERE